MNGGRQGRRLRVMWNKLDVLDSTTLDIAFMVSILIALWRICINEGKRRSYEDEPTFGMVMVLIISLVAKFQRRRVSSETLPAVGFRIVTGIMKSDVRMRFLSKSMLRPWGLNLSLTIFAFPATSLGCSAIMLKLLSVSTRRPGDEPTAAKVGQYIE